MREEELALPQETPALLKLPGVVLGGEMFGSHQGSKISRWGAAGTDAAGGKGGRVGLIMADGAGRSLANMFVKVAT